MRRALSCAVLLVGIVLAFGPPPAGAEDKSYFFPRVTIDATVEQDGSLRLVEHRTFEFHGSFSFAYFDIDWPFERISDFRVLEGGKRLIAVAPTELDGRFRGIWTYSAQDERRTFTITYTARCAVDVFSDTAHLLWQFIGTGWSVPTDFARITVHIPGRASGVARPSVPCPKGVNDIGFRTEPLRPHDVRAWGHGPFSGTVRIADPQTVVYTVRHVPPATFVEGSITFPPRSVPKAYLVPRNELPAILAEERRLADEANALRNRHRIERLIAVALYAALPILFLLLVLLAYARDRVSGVPRHLQEPPEDMHPVELAYLWTAYSGRFSPKNAYRAQLLHLASDRDIEITAVGQVSQPTDFTLRRLKEPDNELDRDFVHFLFMDDRRELLSLDTLRAEGKRRGQLLRWTKDATTKTKGTVQRIRKGKARLESHLVGWLSVLAIAGSYFLGSDLDGGVAFGLIPVTVVCWLVAVRLMPPRLDPKLRERLARWKAFRRFLKDFSSLPDAPALAVVIWGNYMVEAVALNVAKRVEKQVRGLVAEDDLPSPWPGAPAGAGGAMWNRTFLSSPVAAAAASVAHSSSSWSGGWGSSSSGGGFSGGGFSGGGGGGGGGTGGGAG